MPATKTSKLLQAFSKGQKLTAEQIANQFGFSSTGSVYSVISNLRESGHNIAGNPNRSGITQYGMGR